MYRLRIEINGRVSERREETFPTAQEAPRAARKLQATLGKPSKGAVVVVPYRVESP